MQMTSDTTIPAPTARAPIWLRIGFWGCIVIAVAVVIRRLFALAAVRPASSRFEGLDTAFANHTALTLAHILPALVFVILAPIVVFGKTPRFAWAEQLLFPIGAIVGLTAYAMSLYSIGGWLERSAVLFFDTLFLFSLFRAYRYRQSGDLPRERRWLLLSIGILLGIATTRPVMGVFFATSRLTHLAPSQFFGMAFWVGFSINTIIVGLWLRARRRA
ncbi:MAG TPA: hypothetical protein VGG97_04125 [Bryobacteraceae bacterium]